MTTGLAGEDVRCASTSPRDQAGLEVRRTDIWFENVAPELVRVTVSVHNRGDDWSQPTTLGLQWAPFGAFLPWTDVATVAVPEIAPGGVVQVTTDLPVERLKSSGDTNLPPTRLLTALAGDDDPDRQAERRNELSASRAKRAAESAEEKRKFLEELRESRRLRERRLQASRFELEDRSVHWVGNINVLIGNHAVERHMANALRIYPGKRNHADFYVGSYVGSASDRYRFELGGSGAGWNVTLFPRSYESRLQSGTPAGNIEISKWIKLDGRAVVKVNIMPPESCEKGKLDVHIHQESTGKEAVVEFSLDPNAAGPGCYTV